MSDQHADMNDFTEINKVIHSEGNPFGATGPELYSVPSDAVDRADRDVAFAAARHLPKIPRGKPLEYRFAVIRQYVQYENIGPKRLDGKPFRTAPEHRLDRAFTDVAASYNRCESTIRAACTKAYRGSGKGPDDSKSPVDAFREDCQRTLETVRDLE